MLEPYPKRPDPALFLLESDSLDGPKALARDSIILFSFQNQFKHLKKIIFVFP